MQYNKPIILLLNMIDVAEAKGIHIDAKKLEKELGIKVIPIIAKKKEGLENIDCYKKLYHLNLVIIKISEMKLTHTKK